MFNCVTVCIRGILREFIRTPIKIICPRRSRGLMIILPGRRSQAKVKCIAHWLLLEPLSRARGQKPTYPLQPISSRCRPHLKRRGLYWVRGGRGGHAAQKKETNRDQRSRSGSPNFFQMTIAIFMKIGLMLCTWPWKATKKQELCSLFKIFSSILSNFHLRTFFCSIM